MLKMQPFFTFTLQIYNKKLKYANILNKKCFFYNKMCIFLAFTPSFHQKHIFPILMHQVLLTGEAFQAIRLLQYF